MAEVSEAGAPLAERWNWHGASRWLGVGGALVGLALYALPWYAASGGARYNGLRLLTQEAIRYSAPASAPQGEACAGALTGFGAPVAALALALLLALAAHLALGQRRLAARRGVSFALALVALVAGWLGLFFALPWIIGELPTDLVSYAPVSSCGEIGTREPALTGLGLSLGLVIVVSRWRIAWRPPAAPWLLGTCAALGLLGFAAPWDLKLTPGAWYLASATNCLVAANGDGRQCVPTGLAAPGAPLVDTSAAFIRLVVAVNLPFYLIQVALLLAVLVVALLAGRGRTAGWLRALQVISLVVGILGMLSGALPELISSLQALAAGASLVPLAFILLTLFALRAGVRRP